MKKTQKSIAGLFGVALVLVASSALAVNWSTPLTIAGLDIETNGTGTIVWINPGSSYSGKPSCGTNPSSQLELKGSADTVKTMTSAALAVYLAGKQAKLLFDGSCDGNYTYVVGITTL